MFAFPVSLDLRRRRCVVIGELPVAEGKVQALLDGGATDVLVVATAPEDRLARLEADGSVTVERRQWRPEDLDAAFLAVAHDRDPRVRQAISGAARRRGVLVNVVDDMGASDWAWPAVLRRGRLVLAAGTGGASPALARGVRSRLEEQYGPEWAELTDLLAEVREQTKRQLPDLRERMRRWREALDLDEAARMVREARSEELRASLLRKLGPEVQQ